jgi:hypothetical protein
MTLIGSLMQPYVPIRQVEKKPAARRSADVFDERREAVAGQSQPSGFDVSVADIHPSAAQVGKHVAATEDFDVAAIGRETASDEFGHEQLDGFVRISAVRGGSVQSPPARQQNVAHSADPMTGMPHRDGDARSEQGADAIGRRSKEELTGMQKNFGRRGAPGGHFSART